jgi:hypothetical protein
MAESQRTRSLALIGPLAGRRRVIHTAGFPIDPAKMLPSPDVILLIAGPDPTAMLFRYTAHGEFGGDTWHASVDSARDQAAQEYEDALGEWVDVPEEVADAHSFAVQYANERLNSRGGW